jgi:uncharacterized protein (TIGR02246 family)
MKSTRLAAFLIVMSIPLTTLAAPATPEVCVKPSKSQVEKFFDNWNAALQTRDPKTIIALYAEDGVLLPTLSNIPRTNHQELENYFNDFVKKHPSGKIESRTIRSGCDWATDTGIYTFTLYGNYPNDKQEVSARYSYAYEDIDGKWLIVSHHSSLLPNSKEPEQDKKEMAELEPKGE